MLCTDPGHKYLLDSFEGEDQQNLVFINKKDVEEDSGELSLIHDGTTNEEVLKMLIDRMQYLQGLCPCRENAIVITKLEEALMWLERRTADRENRQVEGTSAK